MFVTTSTTILTTFAALATTLPTSHLSRRAGGPSIKPIPSNCTITNPAGTSDATFLPVPTTQGALLYSSYYPSFSTNTTLMQEQCLQQCYGYGDSTQCKAAFWAENVAVPEGYHGSPGGQREVACLFYTRAFDEDDFEATTDGQGIEPYARNLAC